MATNRNTKRKDKARVVLRKGESQRKDGKYDFRWTSPDGKRHSIYAATLEELREKENDIQRDSLEGIKAEARYVTLNDVFTPVGKGEAWSEGQHLSELSVPLSAVRGAGFPANRRCLRSRSRTLSSSTTRWQTSGACRSLRLTVYTRFCIRCWTWRWMTAICGAIPQTTFCGS